MKRILICLLAVVICSGLGCKNQTPGTGGSADSGGGSTGGGAGGTGGDGASGGGSSSAPAGGSNPTERLQPTDFTYLGAFRLPDEFNWGARGLSFYPDGDGGTGSLLVTGFELPQDPAHPGESCWDPAWHCNAYFSQVTIPTPTVEANSDDLPQATIVGSMTNF
ncbi:MAG TPA: hypothetical protein VLM89_08145, partial [Phycisphaerae bacterium]|nr:hypothetical protein [Phycisphaerae bacterium]